MPRSYDLVIRGGKLLDGTGAPARTADVALRGETIADIGAIMPTDETPLLEAAGLTVAPGFIDAWAAADPAAPAFPVGESKLIQGVTTDVAGAGRRFAFPLGEGEGLGLPGPEKDLVAAGWSDARSFLLRVSQVGSGLNRAFFAGYGRIRETVVGPSNAPPTRDETRRILKELVSALEAGCLGLAVDLGEPPAAYAGTEEIVELARALAGAGAVLALSLRDVGPDLEAAVEEALGIASRTGVELLLPALRIGPLPYWKKIGWLESRLERAIDSGVSLTATVEPYVARAVTLSSLLPAAEREGGAEAVAERLRSATRREELARELAGRAEGDEGYWARIALGDRAEPGPKEVTKSRTARTVADVARSRKRPPAEAFLDLVAEEPDRQVLFFELNEGNLERMLGWDFVAVGSGEPARPLAEARASAPIHPAARGAFARVLRRYVREKTILSLEEAVRRVTSLPAERLRLGRRGRILVGHAADIVLFRAESVADRSSFTDPAPAATGVDHVIVGGRLAVRDGKPTGVKSGQIIRRA